MSSRIRALVLSAMAIAAAVVYTAHLGTTPIYLNNDETEFALQAHAIATTARDDEGRFLPLYFHVFENVWFHPALVYAMAPVLAVVPPKPWAVRLPTAAVAVANILLVFLLARRLGASDPAAIGASVLLALAPAHVIHGRLACDYLYPVPCVLAWLILLVDYDRSRSSWRLFAAGSVLGLGLYTYVASIVMMPVYLLTTYLVLWLIGARSIKPYATVTAGFVLLLLPLAAWLIAVPEVYAGLTQRYGGAGVDVLGEPGTLIRADLMAQRWAVYRSFFEWRFLFDRAESSLMSSTHTSGVFLKATAVLFAAGAYHILRNRRTAFTVLVLAGFLSAPLAASLIPETHTIDRALVLLPMGAVIAAFGIDCLLVRRTRFVDWGGRAVCVGLFIWMAVQFNGFYRDYLTGYRVRSAFWFNGNHPGAFEPIVQHYPPFPKGGRPAPGDPEFIYLSDGLPWIRQHWKLYLIMRGRTDLLTRTVYFTPHGFDLTGVTPGSVLLTGANDPAERELLKTAGVRTVAHTVEPDGSFSFTRFERTRGEHLRSREELMALARALATDKDAVSGPLRQSLDRTEEADDTREPLALVRSVIEGQQYGGSAGANVIRAGGGVVAPADMHGEATLEGFTARALPAGEREVIVYFTPRQAWHGRRLWMHAYPQGSHEYAPVETSEPAIDLWKPGQLAWEVFRLPAHPYVVYVGVEVNHDLGPAYMLGSIP
jgi:4-amino-4-deoxy-L-arabinose transferase-like glycosyltransferase